MRPALAAGALLGGVLTAGLGQPAATAAAGDPCRDLQADSEVRPADEPNAPLQSLGIPRAQQLLERRGQQPGAGANVAVLDSGVRDGPGLQVLQHTTFTGRGDIVDPHGTTVAGIIAGRPRAGDKPVGVAPGAKIIDVRVYDNGDPQRTDRTELGVDADRLAQGLEWVASQAAAQRIKVVNVSLAVSSTPRLRAAVERLWREDVVVVAASGNRPEEGDFGYSTFGAARHGEDAAGTIYPAAYPHVIAVNATAPAGTAVTDYVLQSSDTDLAAPTFGLVSVGVNGSSCVVDEVATSWSTAVVSGVVSLLRSAYDESAPQVVARLEETASGTTGTPTKLTGYGVVQPLEALTRPLDPSRNGRLARSVVDHEAVRATPPERPGDLLAATREDAVWWGLIGGGVLVVALLLRPVLARRRR